MTAPLTRESAHVARRDARALPKLRIIGRPWWLYDRRDLPGFTIEQIERGLLIAAVKEGE